MEKFSRLRRIELQLRAIDKALRAIGAYDVVVKDKNKETVKTLKNKVFDPVDDKFQPENNRSESIDPRMLAYDAGVPQFYIENALVECNVDDDVNKVVVEAGKITVTNWKDNTKTRWGIKKAGSGYDPTRFWSIEETTLTLSQNAGYFLYARLNLTPLSLTCTIEASTVHREAKRYIESGDLYYKLGYITPTDGTSKRYAEMLWGNTKTPTLAHLEELIGAAVPSLGDIYYLHGNASDITDYRQALTDLPNDAEGTATAAALDIDGEVLIDEFATDAGDPGVTVIPGGKWIFETYASVDTLDGVNTITVRVYKRDNTDAETELFNVTGAITGITAGLITTETVQGDIVLAADDRLVFKYYFSTTSATSRTGTLYFEGTSNYSRIRTAIENPATGADGEDAFVYIAYASDDSGTGFTTTFDANLDYIAILSTDTEIVSPAVGDFAGLWKKYKGEPGADGSIIVQGQNFYFHDNASEISGYNSLLKTPPDHTENDDSVSVAAADGEVLIEEFATIPNVPGTQSIDAGIWDFRMYHYVDNGTTGDTTFVYRVFKRDTGGTETELFNAETAKVSAETTALIETTYNQAADIPLLTDDRLVIKVYAKTTSVASRTAHFVFEGNTNASHVFTPVSIQGLDNVQSDWDETDTGSDAFIKNKPTIPSAYTNLDWTVITAKDIEAGTAQEYVIVIKAREAFTINALVHECDAGTLTGCAVKINGTAVTGLSSVSLSTTETETAATGANTVVAGDRITFHTSTGYTGTPTAINIQLNITR